ncbi:hypothetical protein CMI48_04795 [Candidatus Pacearchaeota archaeon]|nr:hypothetical protein [Candidatus Pacearchaeota archaeon]
MPIKKEKKAKPKKAAKPKAAKVKKEKAQKQIGTVSNYFDHVKAAAIKLTAAVKIGDKLKLEGGGNEFEQDIKEMQINRENVEKAKKGDEIGVIVGQKVRKGYKVFKA